MDVPPSADSTELWSWISSPVALAFGAFTVWMVIDAVRRREWAWVLFLLAFPGFAAFWYFFNVYRAASRATLGFELPGAIDRRRIRELQAQIHHLDKAHHHAQLGDIYFQQGKLEKAEAGYRAALARDPQDLNTLAHLGQCLLRAKKPAEARPLLEGAVARDPRHDYGHTLMALAEAQTALGETDAALETWRRATEDYSYPRARVQLAELYAAIGRKDAAAVELNGVITEHPHSPAFQRKRDRVWVRRAKRLLRKLR